MPTQILTQKTLKSLLSYNPCNGLFTWEISPTKNIKIGRIAGCSDHEGYILIRVNNILYKAHRLAWLYMYGVFPKNKIDHIDGDTGNNIISNLRDVSDSQNSKNRRIQINNKTGLHGVIWRSKYNKWESYIGVNRKYLSLGTYDNLLDASCARKSSEIKLGFHLNHGRN